jgi:hypothetical protein
MFGLNQPLSVNQEKEPLQPAIRTTEDEICLLESEGPMQVFSFWQTSL